MALEDIRHSCFLLDSDKVTERKKGFEQLRGLLNNSQIVAFLDTRSENTFNWDEVFSYSKAFFLKEARKLEEDERKKPDATQSVLSSRDNMKRNAAALPRLIMSKSSQKTPHVSAHLVIDLVLYVLDRARPYLLENFAGDFIQLAQKYLFRFQQYSLSIRPEKWKELLWICIWVYEKGIPNVDNTAIIGMIEGIVKCCCRTLGNHNPMIILRPVPCFLKRSLTSSKLSSQYGLQTSLLSLLLTFTKMMAGEWRQLVCSIGEETFNHVLAMWDSRPTRRQSQLLEYLNLLILVHDPQEEGAYMKEGSISTDPIIWQRCLYRLYQLIHDHLSQLSTKNKLSGVSGSFTAEQQIIPHNLVSLSARLCSKIFRDTANYGVLDITQSGSTQGNADMNVTQAGKANKRRRIEVGLQPLASKLREEGTHPHVIPWYQILLELLKSYSGLFDTERCLLMLDMFTCTLGESRVTFVQEHIIQCLGALALQYNKVFPEKSAHELMRSGKWSPVWDLVLRLVSGKQCSKTGLELLQILMKTGLVAPDLSIFKLFYQGYVDMNATATSTLLVALTTVSLPKTFKNELSVLAQDQVQDARSSLRRILLPLEVEGPSGTASLESPLLLAQVLVLTCLRDSCIKQAVFMQHQLKPGRLSNRDPLTCLAEHYLLSSFSKALPLRHTKLEENQENEKWCADMKILPHEQENMVERVVSYVNQLLPMVSEEGVTVQDLTTLLLALELIVSLQLYMPDARLETLLDQVMGKVGLGLKKIWNEPELNRWNQLLPLLEHLSTLYSRVTDCAKLLKDQITKRNREEVRKLLMSKTPAILYGLILEAVRARATKPVNTTQLGSTQIYTSRRPFTSGRNAMDDDFEMDFDDRESESTVVMKNDFEEFGSDDEDKSNGTVDQLKLDDNSTLSFKDKCIVEAQKLIVFTHGFVQGVGRDDENNQPLLEVAELMEDLAKSSQLEMTDVVVILNFVVALFKAEYDEANMQDGFVLLSAVSKKYSSEPQVASFIIKIITDFLTDNGASLSDTAKQNVVCLSQAFAQKHHMGSYSYFADKAIFQLMVEMTKLDPKREWSKFRSKNGEGMGELHHLLCDPSHEQRIMAARLSHLLLTNNDGTPLDSRHQDQMFRKVYETALGNLSVQGTVPDLFSKDENNNRVATLLLTLGVIAANSPYLEAKALFAMCFWAPGKEVDTMLVARVVTRVAESRGKPLQKYVRHHLPYLAREWLQHGYDLDAFPFSLLECSSAEAFIRENINILVPVFFECDQIGQLDHLAKACAKDIPQLLREAFSTLMAYIFPCIAAEADEATKQHLQPAKIFAARKHYKFMEKTLGSDQLNTLLDKDIDKITLTLLKLVHDPTPMVEGEVVVPPNPPHFPPVIVEKTLEYLGALFGEDNPLVSVLATRGAELINVMVGVLGFLAHSSTQNEARHALSSIAVLIKALLPHLGQKLREKSTYIINTSIHTLTYYTTRLQELAPYLADHCNELLLNICQSALECCPDRLSSVIPLLFTRLLPLTRESSSVRESTMQIITRLVMCEQQDIQKAVAHLPPFPDTGDYQCLTILSDHHGQLVEVYRGNLLLYDEVENFLALSIEQTNAHSVSHILKLIQNNRSQVKQLYSSPDMEGVTVGHRLTQDLMNLTLSTDEKVALEASKCLGELGPIPLNSPIFHITKEKYPLNSENVRGAVAPLIIKTLNVYLTSEHIDIVEAASSSLLSVLSTREGYKALQEMDKKLQVDLAPYVPKHKPKDSSISYTGEELYESEVGCDNVWQSGTSYEDWVICLACTLIGAGCSSEIITHILPVCRVKAEFSALMLPYIIHATLLADNGRKREVLSRQISFFFQQHVEKSKHKSDTGMSNAVDQMCLNKSCIQVLLSVIDYLRAQTPERSFTNSSSRLTPWEKNWWLRVNYLQVAQAAHYCGAHFSAILYLHLSSEELEHEIRENSDKETDVNSRQVPPLCRLSHLPENTVIRRLMLQIYSTLGDSDGVEGCGGGSKLAHTTSRALRCQHRGQWMETLAIHDAANSTFGMITSLQELGFFNTVNQILSRTSAKLSPELSAAQWESAWRLAQWDLDLGKTEEESHTNGTDEMDGWNFHKHLFHSLQCLRHQEAGGLMHHALQAKKGVITQIRNSRAESSSSVYPLLTQLQILSEVEAASLLLSKAESLDESHRAIGELEELWASKDQPFNVDFRYKESILAARISVLQSLPARHGASSTSLLHKTLLSKSMLSRESLRIHGTRCESALQQTARLDVSKSMAWRTRLEEAHVARCKGDSQDAGQILSSLLEEMEGVKLEPEQEEVLCQSLNLYGCILMDSRARSPNTIFSQYFNKAVSILESKNSPGSNKVLENSYHQLAVYGDKLYHEVHQYLESDTIQAKRENIQRSQEELKRIKNLYNACTDFAEKKEVHSKNTLLQKNIAIDMQVLRELEVEEQEYIFLALQNYLKCLRVSSEHDLHMHRVVALWLENTQQKINQLIHEYGSKIKSYKFVPLIYQLVARLKQQNDKKDTFPLILLNLLEQTCKEHPHHCLPVVMALANAHVDDALAKSGGKKSRSQECEIIEEDRVQAAKLLVNRLKKTPLAGHVDELERICLAYLTLANWSGTKDRYRPGEKVKISSNQPLMNLGSVDHTAALTRPLPLQPSGYYTPPVIIGLEPMCTFVGGINAPKRLTLKTSDGLQQYELLKGKDDIRQDAVMEQVFGIVNELLAKNSETRDRSLSVRTYQVTPLSQKSGLIQWCNNTQAFGEYLIGPSKNSGAHKLYYPNDYTASVCREMMGKAKGKSLEARYEVFEKILENFHPVFRHFFFENYPSPHEWYKRRLAYTRSVATNSMVGYVLGLGDRHVENILLDKSTAELIHIDLGIAFELGKILPTPETVPFRLTQDVRDGLGVMGVEGPLRRCCEATLSVLRNSGEVLVTVVEVLRHDPLHQWTLSPHQIARLQENDDEDQELGCTSSASMADRVVLRVQQKLAGVEDGFARSVPEQVTFLIQQATDLSNLSRLFQGWQPYL
ncbi:serine-protein kinase ATM isoform X2 [Penaeus vannamei]|uniref:serine-protein kinase ATM isoform X2 n=1 Tax=Penaeus vannamei TaxID=6689 RepID=UPI00387F557F